MFLIALLLHGVNEALHGANLNVLVAAQFAIVLPYMFVALRRVYAEPPRRTFWKTLALLVLTFVIDAPIHVGAMLVSVALTWLAVLEGFLDAERAPRP